MRSVSSLDATVIAAMTRLAILILCLPMQARDAHPTIAVGDVLWSTLTEQDTELLGYGRAKTFEATPTVGGRLTVSLKSYDFDAFLRIEDSDGRVLGEDDNSGVETNARLALDAEAGRRYRVIAAAATSETDTGEFSLTMEAGEAAVLDAVA